MTFMATASLLVFVVVSFISRSSAIIPSTGNDFDTYNVDECGKRVRRNWFSLTGDEQEVYIKGLVKIRENGYSTTAAEAYDNDRFYSIANCHASGFGSVVHVLSQYFYWHSYILWEVESQIRALGGEFACFAMPYWDFWTTDRDLEEERGYMFQGAMGGNGDVDDNYTVHDDWPWTNEQFWVPTHCWTDEDAMTSPLCSFKRNIGNFTQMPHAAMGKLLMKNSTLLGLQRAYTDYMNNGNIVYNMLLGDALMASDPANPISSYDPVWYLFHSMITLHQYMWTDCLDYDQIAPGDLDNYPDAYTPHCYDEEKAIEMGLEQVISAQCLDCPMYLDESLQSKTWSLANISEHGGVTVRMSYHMQRWNVIYDLEDGSGFYSESGYDEFCDGKLNPEWFLLDVDDNEEDVYSNEFMVNKADIYTFVFTTPAVVMISAAVLVVLWAVGRMIRRKDSTKLIGDNVSCRYGTLTA